MSYRNSTRAAQYALAYEPDYTATDVGITIYADDITKCVIPGPGPLQYPRGGEAKHLLALASTSSRHLSNHLGEIGVSLNDDKRATLAKIFG